MLKRSYRETQGLKGAGNRRSWAKGLLETRLETFQALKAFTSYLALKNAALLTENTGAKWEGQPYCSTNG